MGDHVETKITVRDNPHRMGNHAVRLSHRDPLDTQVTACRGNASRGQPRGAGASSMGKPCREDGVSARATVRRRCSHARTARTGAGGTRSGNRAWSAGAMSSSNPYSGARLVVSGNRSGEASSTRTGGLCGWISSIPPGNWAEERIHRAGTLCSGLMRCSGNRVKHELRGAGAPCDRR